MKCAYHPDKNATAWCSQCKKPLCDQCAIPGGDRSSICSRCVALQAAQEAVEGIDTRRDEKERKTRTHEARRKWKSMLWMGSQWSVLVICLCIMAFQIPNLILVFKEKKPIRHGTYRTNDQTDQCIRNLWHIVKMLQEGKLPGKDILCPASNKPYVVMKTKEDVVVRSPNPELYGFKEIRVSKKRPVPELIK